MKKIVELLLILLMCSSVSFERVEGVTLEGGIEYTVERARREVFSKVSQTISMSDHEKYKIDPGYSLDRNGKAKIKKFGRNVTFFSDGGYCVWYSSNIHIGYYYDEKGKLIEIDNDESRGKYPRYIAKYDVKGNLVNVFYCIKPGVSYCYAPDKTYLGKWVGNEFYDKDGNLTKVRTK